MDRLAEEREMLGSVDRDFALEALRRCVLFRGVDRPSLETVAESLRLRRYRRDQVIFYQGDPGESLFVIESGSVKIVLASPEDGEDQAIIATLGAGEFFGELALLDGAPHSATAVAMEPTETLVLRRDAFLQLIDRQPGLRRALLSALAGELRRLTGHVEELHFLDLPGRLAIRLVRMAGEAAPGVRRDVRMNWPYTQAELAAMIGGTRQTVNRLLADAAGRGLVRFEKETIVIPDLDRLAHEAER